MKKNFEFTFNGISVIVDNYDYSSNKYLDKDNGFEFDELIFDKICNKQVFNEDEVESLRKLSHRDFMQMIVEL